MLKKILKIFLPTFIILTIFSLWRWQYGFLLVFFSLGTILGIILLETDHLFYAYLQAPHEYDSQKIRYLLGAKKYREALLILFTRSSTHTVFHSVFFQFVFLVILLFVFTSSSSLLGKGLVFGIFLHMLIDQFYLYLSSGNIADWFWQFKETPPVKTQKVYLFALTLVFLFLSLILI